MKDKILHTLLRALPMVLVLAVLAGIAVWLNRTDEDETASDASQMGYASGRTTRRRIFRTLRAAAWEIKSWRSESCRETIRTRS